MSPRKSGSPRTASERDSPAGKSNSHSIPPKAMALRGRGGGRSSPNSNRITERIGGNSGGIGPSTSFGGIINRRNKLSNGSASVAEEEEEEEQPPPCELYPDRLGGITARSLVLVSTSALLVQGCSYTHIYAAKAYFPQACLYTYCASKLILTADD